MRSERLPEKLLKIRKDLDLSQTELLRRLGFENSTLDKRNIGSYENGRTEPPLPLLLEYAKLAGVCVGLLIDDDRDLPEKLPATPRHKF